VAEFHPNDVSRDATPGVWIFEGRWTGLLVIGGGIAIFGTLALTTMGVDLIPAIGFSLLPLGGTAAFVATVVNGKPPSYPMDLIHWGMFRFRTWLYWIGALDNPPQLWAKGPAVPHPTTFGNNQ
jgi:hypothetical protein